MKNVRRVILLGVALLLVTGCSSNDSMNKIVQNGGTILVSLGAHEELGQVNLAATNLSAKLIDSSAGQANVKVRAVFPLNVDKTSSLNHTDFENFDGVSGFWFAVIDLVDPVSGLATNLATGNATLQVQGLPSAFSRSIKILGGQGAINPILSFAGIDFLNVLDPASQVKYLIDDPQLVFTEQNLMGAIEFRFQYPAANVSGLAPADWPRGVSATNNEQLQIQSFTKTDGTTNTLHVVVLNPAGIGAVSEAAAQTTEFYQASRMQAVRFSVVYPPQVSAALFASGNAAVIGYGLDGSEINTSPLVITNPTI